MSSSQAEGREPCSCPDRVAQVFRVRKPTVTTLVPPRVLNYAHSLRERSVNLTIIKKLLSAELLGQVHARLATQSWVDGLETAGAAATRVKRNLQLAIGSPEALSLGELIKKALLANDTFPALALPRRLSPPLFSRYENGMEYGPHTDDAMRARDGLRTDLAATLFLSEPTSYDGGELIVSGHAVKPQAGDLVLYPATTCIESRRSHAAYAWL